MEQTAENIAIIMASFNGEAHIGTQIESILEQSNKKWSLYIHDDGSTDRTPEIIRKYAESYPKKITIVDGPKAGGAKENFFFLMRHIDAPYVMFCDQDDIWLEDKIEKTFRRMREVERDAGRDVPVMVFTDLGIVDESLGVISERMSEYQTLDPMKTEFRDILVQNVITGCTVMVNRALVKKALQTDSCENVIMHDWWCALVAAYFGRIVYIDESLILYRQHAGNSVGAKKITSIRYAIGRLRNYGDMKKSLLLTRRQAKQFAETYGLNEDSLAYKYSDLDQKNKIQRLAFYVRNSIWKSGILRNAGLIVWG